MQMTRLASTAAAAVVLLLGHAAASADESLKIGLSMPSQIVERFVRDKDFFVAEAAKRGHEVLVQIANEDPAKQNSQVENLVAQGIDVLVINPHDAKSAATAVTAAKGAGIPVVSYVRLVYNADVDAWVADDFRESGRLQAQYLIDHAPKGNYVILRGADEDYNWTLFHEGQMERLKPLIDSGAVKVVLDQHAKGWKPENALAIVENALTLTNNDIAAVLAPNDGLAGGAIQALAAQNLAGKVPVTGGDAGLDAAKRIVAGTQSMTVYRDIEKLAATAVDVAERLANKKPIDDLAKGTIANDAKDVPTVFGAAVTVTKDNLDAVLIESGYQKREEVYGK